MKPTVPLPFLTADSGYDEPTPPGALPYRSENQWMRPYRPGPYRVAGAALLLMLAAYLLVAALIVGMSSTLVESWSIIVGAVLVIAYALRLLRIGIWVSDLGMRQVMLLRTITMRWDEIAAVRTSQQPVRWLGLPRTVQGQAVLITRTDGRTLNELLTDHNADFLGRGDAFDIAADKVEDWANPGYRT